MDCVCTWAWVCCTEYRITGRCDASAYCAGVDGWDDLVDFLHLFVVCGALCCRGDVWWKCFKTIRLDHVPKLYFPPHNHSDSEHIASGVSIRGCKNSSIINAIVELGSLSHNHLPPEHLRIHPLVQIETDCVMLLHGLVECDFHQAVGAYWLLDMARQPVFGN